MPAILLIARAELRQRWLSLLVVGLLAGLTGGALASSAALARRTATADERLHEATHADDVRTTIVGGNAAATTAIGEEALQVPGVAGGRIALGGVARLGTDEVIYSSVMVGPARWGTDLLSPVVAAGRLPRPDRADEVVLNAVVDHASDAIGLGAELELRFLSPAEFLEFDAETPLEGEAGTQEVTVVGIVRYPGEGNDVPPLIGTPALAEAVPEGIGVLGAGLLELEPDADPRAVTEALHSVGEDVERPEGYEEFPAVSDAGSSTQRRAATDTTTEVLTVGLLVLAAAAALAGLLAVGQAALRHHGATIDDQEVETAVGLTTGQRVLGRLLAAIPALALAAALTGGIGLATARLEPPGVLRLVEPAPGWAPNLLLLVLVVLAMVLGTAGLLAATTIWSGRGRRTRPVREAPLVSRVAAVGGRPPTILGLRFALERSGPGGGSTRATIAGILLTLTGVVACATYSASLDHVLSRPSRYGWPTDLVIADAGPAVVDDLAQDERFSTVVAGVSGNVRVDGQGSTALSVETVRGELRWELQDGRPPATRDEIVLGTRVAEDLGKGVGDVVELVDRDGTTRRTAVVGVAVLPVYNGQPLGRGVALTSEGVERVALGDTFPDLGLSVAPGVDRDAVAEELASHYEVTVAELPRDVANLAEIDAVPLLLGGFLVVLGIVMLAHAVLVTTRRRRRDLIAARAMGFTPRQLGTSIIVLGVTVAVLGSLLAVPLGCALGATVWRVVAEGAALVGSSRIPWGPALAIIPLAGLLGGLLALTPASRCRHLRAVGPSRRDE